MINFASLFNQFRSSSNNQVLDLLDQPNTPLSKLIDQESFINQYKSGNSKVIEYMKYDKMKQLIDYITVIGPSEDKKRSYKFPLTAADILSSDNSAIIEFFLPQGKLYLNETVIEDQEVQVQVEIEKQKQSDTKSGNDEKEDASIQKQKTIIKQTLQEQGQNSKQTQAKQQVDVDEKVVQQQQPTQSKNQEVKVEKKTTKVKKIIKVQKNVKVQTEPLIHYLFAYFQQNKQVNYILTGYVSKVLTTFFAKKPIQLLTFLFENNRIIKLLRYIQSRSIGELLLKIFTYESAKFSKEREQFFKSILEKLAKNDQVYVLSNLSAFVSQTIEKAAINIKSNNPTIQFSNIFFSPQTITEVIKNVMSQYENVSVYNAPILLTYLTNVPFTLPNEETVVQQFKKLLVGFIQKGLQKLNVTNINRKKLGFGRVKIIQILNFIIKENILDSREVFGQQPQGLNILLNLCRCYEMNNVLHNQVVKLISIALQQKTESSLSKMLVRQNSLIKFLQKQAAQDVKIRAGAGSQKFRKGFIGHIVQIARLIQDAASKGNLTAQKIQKSKQFEKVLQTLVQKQVYQNNKTLAGFSLKKDVKHEIMFQKDDIITAYFDFLSKSPKPVFQPEPQAQGMNIQNPDFLQQIERQLEQNLTVQQNLDTKSPDLEQAQQAQNKQQQKVQNIQQPVRIEVHFFKGHLQYDVDELMADL